MVFSRLQSLSIWSWRFSGAWRSSPAPGRRREGGQANYAGFHFPTGYQGNYHLVSWTAAKSWRVEGGAPKILDGGGCRVANLAGVFADGHQGRALAAGVRGGPGAGYAARRRGRKGAVTSRTERGQCRTFWHHPGSPVRAPG